MFVCLLLTAMLSDVWIVTSDNVTCWCSGGTGWGYQHCTDVSLTQQTDSIYLPSITTSYRGVSCSALALIVKLELMGNVKLGYCIKLSFNSEKSGLTLNSFN